MKKKLPLILADLPVSADIVELLNGKVDLRPWDSVGSEPLPEVEGIFAYGHPRIDDSLLDNVPNTRVISNCGVGVDHIDLHAAAKRSIPVGNTPGILDGATADMAFCLLLATARRLAEGHRYATGPDFIQHDPGFMIGQEVHGKTLGILGMGRIGYQVARRASGFNMRVLYHNRSRRIESETELGAEYVDFNGLLAQSDFLVVCVPLSNDTRGMVGAAELTAMKPSGFLINIARGEIVDHDALVVALRDGAIAGAGLDVTEPEPLPRDHPLLDFDNVVVTPHLGSATAQTRRRMAELACENLLAGLAGVPLPKEIKASRK